MYMNKTIDFDSILIFIKERLRHELKGPEIRRSNSTSGAKAGGAKSKQQKLLMGAVKRKSNTPSDSNAQVSFFLHLS